MGNSLSCVSIHPTTTATYDMSRIKNSNLPIIWITGQQNTGKKTLGKLIKSRYEFEYINVSDLLREESTKETKRAATINEALKGNKKVSDNVVIDLIKEALHNSTNDKGFVIANFPKNPKQAEKFTKEITNVNFIFYFYSEIPLLIERAQEKSSSTLDPEVLRKDIAVATRDLKLCLSKFTLKIESINTSGLPEETFVKVENALIRRINIKAIKTETDYVQPQNSRKSKAPALPLEEQSAKEKTPRDDASKADSTANEPKDDKAEKDKLVGDIKKLEIKDDKEEKKDSDKDKDSKDAKKTDDKTDKKKEKTEEEDETLKFNEREQSVDEDDSVSLDL